MWMNEWVKSKCRNTQFKKVCTKLFSVHDNGKNSTSAEKKKKRNLHPLQGSTPGPGSYGHKPSYSFLLPLKWSQIPIRSLWNFKFPLALKWGGHTSSAAYVGGHRGSLPRAPSVRGSQTVLNSFKYDPVHHPHSSLASLRGLFRCILSISSQPAFLLCAYAADACTLYLMWLLRSRWLWSRMLHFSI